LVLLTGDPPVCLPMLTEALRKAAMPRAVIEISCDAALDCKEPFGSGVSAAPAPPTASGAEGEEAGSAARRSPILVFDDADQLSDDQVKILFDAAKAEPRSAPAGEGRVLVARSSFPNRFEGQGLGLLKGGLAAHLRVQHLDRDEVEAFIRFQLPPDSGSTFLTGQRVALIAITSGGDPAVVNRLARRMLEQEPGAPAGSLLSKLSRSGARKPVGEELTAETGASIAASKISPPKARWRRSAAPLKLAAGIIACLGILGSIVVAFGSKDFDDLLRIPVLHKDSSIPSGEGPARAALPLVPPVATGSPSAGGAVDPPRAAPEPAAEPVAAGPERPRAAPLPPSAPEPTGSPAPAGPRLSADEITALVARGDAFLGAGDIVSARAFFQRAADAGDSRAAMRMAMTFDAAFLDRAGVHGVRGDPEQAGFWFRRARDLGEAKTERETPPSTESPSRLR
jgi:hypothetical protein